jgi:hypothetical protein
MQPAENESLDPVVDILTPSATEEDLLLAYLKDRDAACPLCGYNVRNLTIPRCPECGRELRLHVGLADPFLAAWILSMTAVALAAGAGLFFTPFVIAYGWPEDEPWSFNLAIGVCIAAIPVMLITVVARRGFMRLERRLQWLLAAGAAVISASAFVTFLTKMR